jgi:murein L,D-transpeptidase YafK
MMSRVVISIFVVVLFGLTGAKVGALWPLQQDKLQSPPLAKLSSQASLVSDQTRLNSENLSHLERLNQRLNKNNNDFEASLLKGLLLFQAGALDDAIAELRGLTRRAPKFQLAHLVLGDLLTARFEQLESIGTMAVKVDSTTDKQLRLKQLQSEAKARILGYLSLADEHQVPKVLMSLSENTAYALVVDKSKNRLYVYRNAGPGLPPELMVDFYIVLGKVPGNKVYEGDLKTPSGVYFVTSYLPDEKLPPLYGSGAFPVNYPNELDRKLKKTGSGIWLHGTDKSLYSRPPLDSEGCVVLTNDEFSRISEYVEVGRTPVVISEAVEWISSREWLDLNIELQAALETWRQNWEQTNVDAYLQMYSQNFWTKGYDSKSWSAYKKLVFNGKSFQKIDLSDISLLSYPSVERDTSMVVANFKQHYRSNNFNGNMRKRLYMVRENESWKILYEGHQ